MSVVVVDRVIGGGHTTNQHFWVVWVGHTTAYDVRRKGAPCRGASVGAVSVGSHALSPLCLYSQPNQFGGTKEGEINSWRTPVARRGVVSGRIYGRIFSWNQFNDFGTS